MSLDFSAEEILRYSRHLLIPEVGLEGQKKLKAASVLVIGTIEACSMIFLKQSLAVAAYEGARTAIVPGTTQADVDAAFTAAAVLGSLILTRRRR